MTARGTTFVFANDQSTLGINSVEMSFMVLRTSLIGTPPKLTMQITCVTPIVWDIL
jgi:hypothetical protein